MKLFEALKELQEGNKESFETYISEMSKEITRRYVNGQSIEGVFEEEEEDDDEEDDSEDNGDSEDSNDDGDSEDDEEDEDEVEEKYKNKKKK